VPHAGSEAAMMTRVRRAVPYLIVLAVTAGLFAMATRIEFVAPGGRIGPDFWPKVILALCAVTCLYQVVRTLWLDEAVEGTSGVLESVIEETSAAAEATAQPVPQADEPRFPMLLAAGIALTIAYVVTIERLGFFLATVVYLAAFAWIGRYRRPMVVVLSSVIGSLAFMFVFMKVVYVSLPLGQEPFSQVTFALMRLMGIR
jgi:putative tricarboxylic transport membrane protein